MTLTPEQKAILRQCSRDDDAYQQLLKLFEAQMQPHLLGGDSTLLRTVIDTLPDRVYVKDRQSRFLLANRAMWTHHQMPDEQSMMGRPMLTYAASADSRCSKMSRNY